MLKQFQTWRTALVTDTRRMVRAAIGGILVVCGGVGVVLKVIDRTHAIDVVQSIQGVNPSGSTPFIQPVILAPLVTLPGVTKLSGIGPIDHAKPNHTNTQEMYTAPSGGTHLVMGSQSDLYDIPLVTPETVTHVVLDRPCDAGIAISHKGGWLLCFNSLGTVDRISLPTLQVQPLTMPNSNLDSAHKSDIGIGITPDDSVVAIPEGDVANSTCQLDLFEFGSGGMALNPTAIITSDAFTQAGGLCALQPHWSSDGKQIDVITVGSTINTLDLTSYLSKLHGVGGVISVPSWQVTTAPIGNYMITKWTTNDHQVLVIGDTGVIALHDLVTGKDVSLLTLGNAGPYICTIALAPDGHNLAFSLCSYQMPADTIVYENYYVADLGKV